MKTKISLIALFLITGYFAQAQTKLSGNFHIDADVTPIKSAYKVLIFYRDVHGDHFTDSALVRNGHFTLNGALKEPQTAQLMLLRDPHNRKRSVKDLIEIRDIFLEPTDIHIKAADTLFKSLVITGSILNIYYKEFNEKGSAYTQQIKLLAKQIAKTDTANHAEISRLRAEIKKYWAEEPEKVSKPFLLAHLNDYMSLYVLESTYAGVHLDTPEVEILYDKLKPRFKNQPSAIRLKERIASSRMVTVGNAAPDFSQPDTSGKLLKLSSLRGKYVLLDFWASWCVPCRAENPNVVKAYNKYKGKNLVIVSVSIDGHRKEWLKAVKEDNLAWAQVSDLNAHNQAARLYGVAAIPQNFLIDPSGKIVAHDLRGEALDKKLTEFLGL